MLKDKALESIGTGLSINESLTWLDFSNNSLGDEGAAHIAHSLMYNRALTHLDLKSNGVHDHGAICLSTALVKNTTLRTLNLDRNTLGSTGGQELLKVYAMSPTRGLSLSEADLWVDLTDPNMASCNCKISSEVPAKDYEFDLSRIIDRSCFYRLILIAARMSDISDPNPNNFVDVRLDNSKYEICMQKFLDPENIPKDGIITFTFVETKRDISPSLIMPRDAVSPIARLIQSSRACIRLRVLIGLCYWNFFETEDIEVLGNAGFVGPLKLEVYAVLLAHTRNIPKSHGVLQKLLGYERYSGSFKETAGSLFWFNPDNISGHYKLNLRMTGDRMLFKRLMEICSEQQRTRREQGIKTDNSQKGNNEYWRNESLDGVHSLHGP